MIRTLVVDDERLARERLRRMLSQFADIEIVGEAQSGGDAVPLIEKHHVALLFLDVQMPGIDGFETLRLIEPDARPSVIFVTAHDQYAVAAFENNAVDYLLKPVRHERLEQALERARERLLSRDSIDARLNALLELVDRRASYLERLPVRTRDRVLILAVAEIVSLRLEQGLVWARTERGEYWSRYTTLAELDGLLDPAAFLRIHRQVIVNLKHVREVTSFDKHSARLTLTGGHQVTASRNHLKRLRAALCW